MAAHRLRWIDSIAFALQLSVRVPALKKKVRQGKSQEVRINSGTLRGRKLAFPDIEGQRPTLGRTRETLFNWLRPTLPDARCLDLFAGSGVLGLEAASIGAGEVVFVENHGAAAKHIETALESFHLSTRCSLHSGDALSFLSKPLAPFDFVFIDPPFANTQLLTNAVTLLVERNLVQQAMYLEFEQQQEAAVEALMQRRGLQQLRSTKAGNTRSWLIAPSLTQG
jgi:16S rRNA (guanine966-N2)-methyltransferase